jgi:hypothetical protein
MSDIRRKASDVEPGVIRWGIARAITSPCYSKKEEEARAWVHQDREFGNND